MCAANLNTAVYTFSHVGHRNENQDRFVALDAPHDASQLFVVADGLGGHSGGALAAQAAIDTVQRVWSCRSPDTNAQTFLKRLVQDAHAAVCRVGANRPLAPRSTLAALLLQGKGAVSIHAGDSRVMQFSNANLIARTLDHSAAQLQVTRGTVPEESLARHPGQAHLFSCIGGPRSPVAEVNCWDVANGARFVVCSDGFWEVFPPEEILVLFASNDPRAQMKQRFERKLASMEHHDNATAVLIDSAATEG